MRIRTWRITKSRYAGSAFSGVGAKTFGGRWNSVGTTMVCTAGSTSLAILEMLVHLRVPDLMKRYVIFEVSFDASLVTSVDMAKLPRAWRRSPVPASVQEVGDRWAGSGRSVVLQVPSVIVPGESNYLLNPAHRDFAKILIGSKQPIAFGPRLIKM